MIAQKGAGLGLLRKDPLKEGQGDPNRLVGGQGKAVKLQMGEEALPQSREPGGSPIVFLPPRGHYHLIQPFLCLCSFILVSSPLGFDLERIKHDDCPSGKEVE